MSTGHGDRLARGARSASFGMGNISKEKWDSIFHSDESLATTTPEPAKDTPVVDGENVDTKD